MSVMDREINRAWCHQVKCFVSQESHRCAECGAMGARHLPPMGGGWYCFTCCPHDGSALQEIPEPVGYAQRVVR